MARTKNTGRRAPANLAANRYSGRSLSGKSQSIRDVVQCTSKTVKRKQCRKRTARTDQCWIHLGKNNNLRVKKSNTGYGFGLFVTDKYRKPIKRHHTIDKYTGRKTTQARLDRRYGAKTTAQYSLCDSANDCLDANLSTHGAPRYANDARGTRFRNNSCFRASRGNYTLQSTKRIKPGQEIFADYGPNYWPRGYFRNKRAR